MTNIIIYPDNSVSVDGRVSMIPNEKLIESYDIPLERYGDLDTTVKYEREDCMIRAFNNHARYQNMSIKQRQAIYRQEYRQQKEERIRRVIEAGSIKRKAVHRLLERVAV